MNYQLQVGAPKSFHRLTCAPLFTLGYEGLSIEAIEQAVVPQLQLPVDNFSQLARQTDSDTFKTLAITRPKVSAVTCNKFIAG